MDCVGNGASCVLEGLGRVNSGDTSEELLGRMFDGEASEDSFEVPLGELEGEDVRDAETDRPTDSETDFVGF